MLAPEGIVQISDSFYRQEHQVTEKQNVIKDTQSFAGGPWYK